MTLTEEQGGFDLERAKGLRDFLQDDCAEVGDVWGEMIAEIERLRAEMDNYGDDFVCQMKSKDARIKELESSLDEAEALTKKNADLMNIYLARIAELEGALVEERARTFPVWMTNPRVARDVARQQLKADGKIGPDAAKPQSWQITEERKETLRRALEEYKIFPNDQAVLRAMLNEAE